MARRNSPQMRTMNRLYAWLFGYFWLPCPICRRMFGGHEVKRGYIVSLMSSRSEGQVVCPRCKVEAIRRNLANGTQPVMGHYEDGTRA